jgi:hypothetical protein
MARALALKLLPTVATATIVRTGGAEIAVEAVVQIPLLEGVGAKSHGETIAKALARFKLGRTPVAAVVPRTGLYWQNYDLPPVPADDLPDLVHMQAQRDLPLADDGEGFDFVPLAGDAEHPYRVLGLGVSVDQLAYIREVCEAAELKLEAVVPEPLGWCEVGRRAAVQLPAADGALQLFAAISGRQAVVWASEGDALRAIRTIWLPEEATTESDVAALASELRRTIMALTHWDGGEGGEFPLVYCGADAEHIAALLQKVLSRTVQAAPLEELVQLPGANADAPSRTEVAPAAAIAAALGEKRSLAADLLHPRRRPEPPSRQRTYALAGIAAALLVLAVAWQAYRSVQAPLEAAAEAAAARAELEPALADLAEDEEKAGEIRQWLAESTNLLTELDYLSQQLRPEPLDSDKLKAEEDVVLTKLAVDERTITINASAKANNAIAPVERRLRDADYRVDRGPVEANSQAVPNYNTAVTAELERVEPGTPESEDPA